MKREQPSPWSADENGYTDYLAHERHMFVFGVSSRTAVSPAKQLSLAPRSAIHTSCRLRHIADLFSMTRRGIGPCSHFSGSSIGIRTRRLRLLLPITGPNRPTTTSTRNHALQPTLRERRRSYPEFVSSSPAQRG